MQFELENFAGPLDLLLFLVRKHEIDISDVPIERITDQYAPDLETGGSFLLHTSTLMLLKSRALLPSPPPMEEEVIEEPEPQLSLLEQVGDYLRYREAAFDLHEREESQGFHFPRGYSEEIPKPPKEMKLVPLENLATLLSEVLERAQVRTIQGEEWSVEEATNFLRAQTKISFQEAFSFEKSRGELVVLFLALLEMMKNQEMVVAEDATGVYLVRRGTKTDS